MASKVISGDGARSVQPMQWHTVGVTPQAGHAVPYGVPDGGTWQTPELGSEMAQLRAKMAIAEAEKDRQIAAAKDACRREGEAAGRRAAEAELRPVMQRLAASIQQVSALPAQLRAQAEGDLVRLGVAIAKRILQRELNVDPAVITGLVRVGLDKVRLQDVMRVRVCPEDQAAIQAYLTSSGAAGVEVSADPSQKRGGVIFETSRGKLDVSIDTQLREIERGLTDRLRGRADG